MSTKRMPIEGAGPLESTLEGRLVRGCKARGALCIKFAGGEPGMPDRLIIAKGQFLWVELKRNGGKVSLVQRQAHAALHSAGCVVLVSRGTAGVTDVLAHVDSLMGIHTL